MTETSGYEDRIVKLLKKAESTLSPEEAEALTAKATQLMVKYGIDRARVEEMRRDGKTEPIIEGEVIPLEGIYRVALRQLGAHVCFGLGTLRHVFYTRANKIGFVFIGYESDVRQAELLFRSLQLQAFVAMTRWWRDNLDRPYLNASQAYQARRSFLLGYGSGVRARLDRARRATLVEEKTSRGTGAELVLARRADVVQSWVNERLGDVKNVNSRMKSSVYDMADGYREGERANTGEESVTPNRSELPSGS